MYTHVFLENPEIWNLIIMEVEKKGNSTKHENFTPVEHQRGKFG